MLVAVAQVLLLLADSLSVAKGAGELSVASEQIMVPTV